MRGLSKKDDDEKNKVLEEHRKERRALIEKYSKMDFYEITKSFIKDKYSVEVSTDEIKEAIANGDVAYMQKFPGIGPKAAQQIILDLRGKIDFEASLLAKDDLDDCVEALIALGYSKKEVNKVIGKVDSSLAQNEIIKQALKLLSKL
jgi:hypothetical protein